MNLAIHQLSLDGDSLQRFFGFNIHPFAYSVDGNSAILLPEQVHARDALIKAIKDNQQIITVTGPSGIGKTIVVDSAVRLCKDNSQIVRIEPYDLDDRASLAKLTHRLTKLDIRFIVDNAENLSLDSLKNLFHFLRKLRVEGVAWQLIFVASTAFWDLHRDNEPTFFEELIDVKITLNPFSENEIHQYMAMRLNLAGVTTAVVIHPRAVKLLVKASNGIPARLNSIASGSFRNAIHSNHKRVSFNDAYLAINKPDIAPDVAYGRLQPYFRPFIVLAGVMATAICLVYLQRVPIVHDAGRSAGSAMRSGISAIIDIFSDHSDEVSPQIMNVLPPVKQVITTDDLIEQRRLLDARTKLLDQLDHEVTNNSKAGDILYSDTQSRANNPVGRVYVVPPTTINKPVELPIVPPILGNTPSTAPLLSAKTSTIQVQPTPLATVPDLSKPTSPPIVAFPVVTNPEVREVPNVGAVPDDTAGKNASLYAAPIPPPELMPLTEAKKPIAPVAVPVKRKPNIPEFCSRMKPTTDAGIAYKKQVCVPFNKDGDIYYKPK